jgi:hypothetical protein
VYIALERICMLGTCVYLYEFEPNWLMHKALIL